MSTINVIADPLFTDIQIRRESIEVEIPPAPDFRIRVEVEIPAPQTPSRIIPSTDSMVLPSIRLQADINSEMELIDWQDELQIDVQVDAGKDV